MKPEVRYKSGTTPGGRKYKAAKTSDGDTYIDVASGRKNFTHTKTRASVNHNGVMKKQGKTYVEKHRVDAGINSPNKDKANYNSISKSFTKPAKKKAK